LKQSTHFTLAALLTLKVVGPRSCLPHCNFLLQNPVIGLTFDRATSHGCPGIPPEAVPVEPQVFGSFFVQGVWGIGLQKEELTKSSISKAKLLAIRRDPYLHPNNDCVQVQDWLPIFPQDVQTNVAFQVNVGVVNLLRTFYLRRVMREVLVDCKCEYKTATFVHALIRLDRKRKIEDIVRIWKGCLHCAAEWQLGQI
jgi:hypothetical protein